MTVLTVPRPSPVRARSLSTKNIHISARRRHRARDTLNSQASDRHTGCRRASRAAVLVILLDDDTILDVGERDALERHACDSAGGTRDGLDANTVV